MDVDPDVTLGTKLGRTGVEAHAHPHLPVVRPAVHGDRALRVDSGARGRRSVRKAQKELVASAVDLAAAVVRRRAPDQCPMLGEHHAVRDPEPVQNLGRAFDVGEQKRDRLRHDPSLRADRPDRSRIGRLTRAAPLSLPR